MLLLLLAGCGGPPGPAPVPEPATEAAEPPSDVAPAWSLDACAAPAPELDWQPVPGGSLRHMRTAVPDLDGDGQDETFDARYLSRDGYAHLTFVLQPSAGEPIVVDTQFHYRDMVHTIDVPEALRGEEKAAWRRPFEHELLRSRCPTVDPSVAWLDREPRSLVWVAGPPVMPGVYGVYEPDAARWRVVAGHLHTMDPDEHRDFPVEDASDGPIRLLRTAHGAILYDTERDAHAWLYVTAAGHRSLKAPSLGPARFDGPLVRIDPARPDDPVPEIRIDRVTGHLVEDAVP